MRIIETHQYGKELHEAFKFRRRQHCVLCHSDYNEQIASIFAHQIQSEYYGGNRCVSIEGIVLDHFSDSNQARSSLTYEAVSRQAVFFYSLLDDRKQDAATTVTYSKHIM